MVDSDLSSRVGWSDNKSFPSNDYIFVSEFPKKRQLTSMPHEESTIQFSPFATQTPAKERRKYRQRCNVTKSPDTLPIKPRPEPSGLMVPDIKSITFSTCRPAYGGPVGYTATQPSARVYKPKTVTNVTTPSQTLLAPSPLDVMASLAFDLLQSEKLPMTSQEMDDSMKPDSSKVEYSSPVLPLLVPRVTGTQRYRMSRPTSDNKRYCLRIILSKISEDSDNEECKNDESV